MTHPNTNKGSDRFALRMGQICFLGLGGFALWAGLVPLEEGKSSLRLAELSHNVFTGTLPSGLGNLNKLREFSARDDRKQDSRQTHFYKNFRNIITAYKDGKAHERKNWRTKPELGSSEHRFHGVWTTSIHARKISNASIFSAKNA